MSKPSEGLLSREKKITAPYCALSYELLSRHNLERRSASSTNSHHHCPATKHPRDCVEGKTQLSTNKGKRPQTHVFAFQVGCHEYVCFHFRARHPPDVWKETARPEADLSLEVRVWNERRDPTKRQTNNPAEREGRSTRPTSSSQNVVRPRWQIVRAAVSLPVIVRMESIWRVSTGTLLIYVLVVTWMSRWTHTHTRAHTHHVWKQNRKMSKWVVVRI